MDLHLLKTLVLLEAHEYTNNNNNFKLKMNSGSKLHIILTWDEK